MTVFKYCVKELKLSPIEFWQMDLAEIAQLLHDDKNNEIDTSIMLNYERVKNGAAKKWLQKNY